MDWQRKIAPLVRAVEKRYDALKYRLYYALGGPRPIKIQPYRGYGTTERLYLKGRMLEKRGITPPSETDNWWNNLVNMCKRMESREVPHARLVARFQGIEQEIIADEEGMFEVWIEPPRPIASDRMWQQMELELVEPLCEWQEETVRATGHVLVPSPRAPYAVISDIDDTIIQSEMGNFLQMAYTMLFSNARTRLPLPGAAAFYRALYAGAGSEGRVPIFYVSNSPWNLYDFLVDFFELNDIPGGPVLLLRNWGIYQDEILPTRQREHKLELTRQILDMYPDLPFLLIGDSGEADPEIYHELVHHYGERILALYIRKVDPDPERAAAIRALANEVLEASSELILADDSLTMARHAAAQGWIAPEMLSEIEAAQARDLAEVSGDAEYEIVEMNEPVGKEEIPSALEESDQVSTVAVESEDER
ncbi:MAG: App1 family protein [Anaerolineales bacterium]